MVWETSRVFARPSRLRLTFLDGWLLNVTAPPMPSLVWEGGSEILSRLYITGKRSYPSYPTGAGSREFWSKGNEYRRKGRHGGLVDKHPREKLSGDRNSSDDRCGRVRYECGGVTCSCEIDLKWPRLSVYHVAGKTVPCHLDWVRTNWFSTLVSPADRMVERYQCCTPRWHSGTSPPSPILISRTTARGRED